ncbi:MAG: hypothetical protein JWM47_2590 [Acidimicrobiales bacterium]|nr:hypothetical protein [Acidimicrobiales bacterium]
MTDGTVTAVEVSPEEYASGYWHAYRYARRRGDFWTWPALVLPLAAWAFLVGDVVVGGVLVFFMVAYEPNVRRSRKAALAVILRDKLQDTITPSGFGWRNTSCECVYGWPRFTEQLETPTMLVLWGTATPVVVLPVRTVSSSDRRRVLDAVPTKRARGELRPFTGPAA